MPFLQLPPEIIIQIFDYVSSSYVRSDLPCLTVCKQWNKFAYTACFRDFHFTQKTLRQLGVSLHRGSRLRLVQDSVERLDLDLKGFQDWGFLPQDFHDSRAVNILNVSRWDDAYGRALRAVDTGELNSRLLLLAAAIRQSRKLRILCIRATSEVHP